MTAAHYARFCEIRSEMKDYIASMLEENRWVLDIQRSLYREKGYRVEELESPIVYNLALDEVSLESEPRFIVVADNPGLQEQKLRNHRYLVGQSGKLAVSWFRKNLNMDFRSAAIIINKTPVHTPKTAELRLLLKLAGNKRESMAALLEQSQLVMARFAIELTECLECPLWVSGIGELQSRGIFRVWAEELRALATHAAPEVRENILLFRHFSMNQFAIEFAAAQREAGIGVAKKDAPLAASALVNKYTSAIADQLAVLDLLKQIGSKNRQRILGF